MTGGFGAAIRAHREGQRLSQTALAVRAGVTRAHLSEVERGKIALPNADFRRRVARALGMSHAQLLVAAGELAAEEVAPPPALTPAQDRLLALLLTLGDDQVSAVLAVAEAFAAVAGGRGGAAGNGARAAG